MHISSPALAKPYAPSIKRPARQNLQFGLTPAELAKLPVVGTEKQRAMLAELLDIMEQQGLERFYFYERNARVSHASYDGHRYIIDRIYNSDAQAYVLKIYMDKHNTTSYELACNIDSQGRLFDGPSAFAQPFRQEKLDQALQEIMDALENGRDLYNAQGQSIQSFPRLKCFSQDSEAQQRKDRTILHVFSQSFIPLEYQKKDSQAIKDARRTLRIIKRLLSASPQKGFIRIHPRHAALYPTAAASLNPGTCRMGAYWSEDNTSPVQHFVQNIADQLKKGDYAFPAAKLTGNIRKGLRTVYERTRNHYPALSNFRELPPEPEQ